MENYLERNLQQQSLKRNQSHSSSQNRYEELDLSTSQPSLYKPQPFAPAQHSFHTHAFSPAPSPVSPQVSAQSYKNAMASALLNGDPRLYGRPPFLHSAAQIEKSRFQQLNGLDGKFAADFSQQDRRGRGMRNDQKTAQSIQNGQMAQFGQKGQFGQNGQDGQNLRIPFMTTNPFNMQRGDLLDRISVHSYLKEPFRNYPKYDFDLNTLHGLQNINKINSLSNINNMNSNKLNSIINSSGKIKSGNFAPQRASGMTNINNLLRLKSSNNYLDLATQKADEDFTMTSVNSHMRKLLEQVNANENLDDFDFSMMKNAADMQKLTEGATAAEIERLKSQLRDKNVGNALEGARLGELENSQLIDMFERNIAPQNLARLGKKSLEETLFSMRNLAKNGKGNYENFNNLSNFNHLNNFNNLNNLDILNNLNMESKGLLGNSDTFGNKLNQNGEIEIEANTDFASANMENDFENSKAAVKNRTLQEGEFDPARDNGGRKSHRVTALIGLNFDDDLVSKYLSHDEALSDIANLTRTEQGANIYRMNQRIRKRRAPTSFIPAVKRRSSRTRKRTKRFNNEIDDDSIDSDESSRLNSNENSKEGKRNNLEKDSNSDPLEFSNLVDFEHETVHHSGVKRGTIVRIKPQKYQTKNKHKRIEKYFGHRGVVHSTPVYPGTWFALIMDDGEVLKCRSSAFDALLDCHDSTQSDGVVISSSDNDSRGSVESAPILISPPNNQLNEQLNDQLDDNKDELLDEELDENDEKAKLDDVNDDENNCVNDEENDDKNDDENNRLKNSNFELKNKNKNKSKNEFNNNLKNADRPKRKYRRRNKMNKIDENNDKNGKKSEKNEKNGKNDEKIGKIEIESNEKNVKTEIKKAIVESIKGKMKGKRGRRKSRYSLRSSPRKVVFEDTSPALQKRVFRKRKFPKSE